MASRLVPDKLDTSDSLRMNALFWERAQIGQNGSTREYMALPVQQTALSEDHLAGLVDAIKDWQFEHGSLLKVPPNTGKELAYPIGVTAFPSNFPKTSFDKALRIQCLFNRLYVSASSDEEWLKGALLDLFSSDSMATRLWKIHCAVKQEGYLQDVSLGMFRSDYMLHTPSGSYDDLSLKQVEFNTYSVAGGAHSNKISNMHRYILHMTTCAPLMADVFIKGILLALERMGKTELK